ncbi:MAG TPA: undecaprenyl-diphosphate phosphatase [Xanthobacteraceae bacterium]|nr:undecaprenyl-diphosphate phosphatase [Xanthobacteraceae bacterium]
MIADLVRATLLGLLEGLTEFLPVSSTGHLLLLGHFFGFTDDDFGKTFVVLIQLGAILAVTSVYFVRLWRIALALPTDPEARRFVIGVLIAFLPAAAIGAALHGFIKGVLFNAWIVCATLIVGGLVLLWVDRLEFSPRHRDATRFPLGMYLGIGVAQCFAMIPGVSRSGATIVSAMLFGADKRSAAEFSFFLAIPTMAGAFAYDLYKNWATMDGANTAIVAVGFLTSLVAGWFVVRSLLAYVSQHGFALFAWWRILVGALGLIGLALSG